MIGASVRRWNDLPLGLRDSFKARFSLSAIDAFATLSGDFNPLHVSEDAARSAGFRGRVIHGLLSSSLYSRLVGMHLPGTYSVLQAIDIGFRNAIFADDDLEVSGEIVARSEAARVVQIRAQILRNGLVLSSAKIRVGILAEAFD